MFSVLHMSITSREFIIITNQLQRNTFQLNPFFPTNFFISIVSFKQKIFYLYSSHMTE